MALITLDPEAVAEWASHHDMAGTSYAQVVSSPAMHRTIEDYAQSEVLDSLYAE